MPAAVYYIWCIVQVDQVYKFIFMIGKMEWKSVDDKPDNCI